MTIKDIAKNCGVSVSTVSRVLNSHPDVSEEVRQRVLEEVERCAYIPNDSARNLVKSSSDAIGVVVRGTENLFFSRMLQTIGDEITQRGYAPVPHFIDSEADEVKAGAILEREKKLRGLLFLGGRYDYVSTELAAIRVPFVCCSYTNIFGALNEESYSSVSIDDRLTACRAVGELISRGHRRIAAVIPARSDRSISELRYLGYLDALMENGVEADSALIEETGGFDMRESYEGVRRLLERTEDFTALFMISDTMAIAGMKALEDCGKRVPQDVSVIAIDGLNVSKYISPTLSTMVQPADEMARESVQILLKMLEDPGYSRHIRLEAVLREGASVRNV